MSTVTKNKKVNTLVNKVDRKALKNNTQRVLMVLLTSATTDGWISRTSISRIPSVTSRLRDLRKTEFGGFDVECVSAEELNRPSATRTTTRQTYYRIVPRSVTVNAVQTALRGVIETV